MKQQANISTPDILLLGLILLFLLGYAVIDYINLPVMGTDHLTGECVWIEVAPNFERRECPAELPTKYHPIPVRSYDATTSGHWGIGKNNEY